jgi:hypothetical protein
MGKVKSMLMDAQETFYDLADIEAIVSESETFSHFNLKLAETPGMIEFMREVGHSTYQYIVTDTWNEFWSNYV